MRVVFLNVGQGDAFLLSFGSEQILIDSGRSGKELLHRLSRHMPFWDRTIEAVIATHPDADHIGGFPALFRAYKVERVFTTGAVGDSETALLFQEEIVRATGRQPDVLFRGGELSFPEQGKLFIRYPITPLPPDTKDTNAGSLVARFVYGKTSFLFTGDLPREETVLADEESVTVLKAAHHGSRYSTSDAFLEQVLPKETIISVGKNSYGHPAEEVLERLRVRQITIRRTDRDGDIVYVCALDSCSVRE